MVGLQSSPDPHTNGDAALSLSANGAPVPFPREMLAKEISDVAVHLDGSEHDEGKIAYAEMVATTFGARVEGCLTNCIEPAPLTGGVVGWIKPDYWTIQANTRDETERRLRLRIARVDAESELRRFDGMANDLVSAIARRARAVDLFVFGVPYGASRHGPQLVEAVLFDAGGTVMIVPTEAKSFADPRTVLIAWKDSIEASRAIAAALPFLKRADLVYLTTVAEGAPDEGWFREPAADMAAHLARHGVSIEIRHLPREEVASEAILNEAKIVGADLIVSGAYGRSRIREMIFGGMTRDLLTSSEIPLLMAN